MCNEVARRIALGQLRDDWNETRIGLVFPEGAPNIEPLDSVRITDPSVVIRASGDGGDRAEIVTRRWSWPGPGGRPVYNFRSDGRRLDQGRSLIPVSAFFEFTAQAADAPARAPRSKWAFTMAGRDWFCIAGLWRTDPVVGEAWTMLTCPPGPDVAPYHPRQVVVLGPDEWARWLDPRVPAGELCRPAEAGTLAAARVR